MANARFGAECNTQYHVKTTLGYGLVTPSRIVLSDWNTDHWTHVALPYMKGKFRLSLNRQIIEMFRNGMIFNKPFLQLVNKKLINCNFLLGWAIRTMWSWSTAIILWRHQMDTFSALLAICVGNSPVPGEFPAQKTVTPTFDVFVDLRPNKQLSKQPWGWWFQMPLRPLWRHRNEYCTVLLVHNPRFKWLVYDDYNSIICSDFAIDDTMCVLPMWTEWENCFHIL